MLKKKIIMTWRTVIAGFIFSGIGGYLVVSLLMDKLIWPYLKKKADAEKDPYGPDHQLQL